MKTSGKTPTMCMLNRWESYDNNSHSVSVSSSTVRKYCGVIAEKTLYMTVITAIGTYEGKPNHRTTSTITIFIIIIIPLLALKALGPNLLAKQFAFIELLFHRSFCSIRQTYIVPIFSQSLQVHSVLTISVLPLCFFAKEII